ncbi:hypothetical protein DH2020_009012 [Rehmannia glutinosa]|uniref:50S ribosomal protein L34 n=1 Tax=Rehmannia glutinosa TaxID=99300 RepID=A0ABR0X5Q4_REHGL
MACCLSMGTMSCNRGNHFNGPSASLSLLTGSRTRTSVSLNVKTKALNSGMLLQSAFAPSSSLSFSSGSSFAGSSLGLDLNSSIGMVSDKRRGLVVRAKKYALCQTKRNRSRKSLARTHGFRKREYHQRTSRSLIVGVPKDDGFCALKPTPTVGNVLDLFSIWILGISLCSLKQQKEFYYYDNDYRISLIAYPSLQAILGTGK